MNLQLQYFIHAHMIRCLNRPLLTRVLEESKDCLPPEAAKVLTAELDHEEFCAAWAGQFRRAGAFGAALVEALEAIETLALPENRPLLEAALAHLPTGFEVNQNLAPLNQALHLWLIAKHTPGVTYPAPSGRDQPATDNESVRSDGGRSQEMTDEPAGANPTPPMDEAAKASA